MNKKYKVAVVGATGMVGLTFIKVLEERNFPLSEIVFFASTRSAGSKVSFNGAEYVVEELTENSFDQGFDFALFSAGGDTSLKFAPIAASKGVVVIDNSSAWRMKDHIKLVVPEVNADVLTNKDLIIANPNCSTIQSVVPLHVIHELFTLKRVIYSTYQAVSGSGYKGVMDLKNGYQNKAPEFYKKQIFDNCFPHIDDFLDNGYTKEEKKMMDETRKILGLPNLLVSATCVRIPVTVGHSVSMNVECEKPIDMNLLIQAFQANKDIVYYEGNNYPTPKDVDGNDLVHVGRLRIDLSTENGIHLWAVADNVRKGAATNAIQIAEYLIKENLV
ncbi:MAG: aspartate-semialdehyde dehydrogenase [Tenericutes bacterium HGW-Tenericutes-2]|jgi:aspartate-semialdehyde dehydrogenase|nr:MAG: aspartate-semialdehyde dehydrogenase [Tenericutes bacterium HGW-Tenericutes-2]